MCTCVDSSEIYGGMSKSTECIYKLFLVHDSGCVVSTADAAEKSYTEHTNGLSPV